MDNDRPLRAALQKLLSQGEAASDNRMRRQHQERHAPPEQAAGMCPECTESPVALVDGRCPQCDYEATPDGESEGEIANLLEHDAGA